MNGGSRPGTRQFNAVDQMHTQRFTGLPGFGDTAGGVMVSQSEYADAALMCAPYQLRGRQLAIRSRAVTVQVDIKGTGAGNSFAGGVDLQDSWLKIAVEFAILCPLLIQIGRNCEAIYRFYSPVAVFYRFQAGAASC